MFTIQYVKDLQWANQEKTMFTCVVKYEEFDEEHPSGIVENDVYSHIKEIWVNANLGVYGLIADYVPQLNEDNESKDQPITEGTQDL